MIAEAYALVSVGDNEKAVERVLEALSLGSEELIRVGALEMLSSLGMKDAVEILIDQWILRECGKTEIGSDVREQEELLITAASMKQRMGKMEDALRILDMVLDHDPYNDQGSLQRPGPLHP